MVRKSADLRGRENKDMSWAVADPDIQIRVGPGHPDSEIKGGGPVLNKNFLALRASVWSNNKGRAGPPGPFPRSATVEA